MANDSTSAAGQTPEITIPHPLLAGYVVVVAVAYQYGFWSPFDVNVLQYTSLLDLAKITVWPFVTITSALIVGNLLGYYTVKGRRPRPKDVNERLQSHRGFAWLRTFINAEPVFTFYVLVSSSLAVMGFEYDWILRWMTLFWVTPAIVMPLLNRAAPQLQIRLAGLLFPLTTPILCVVLTMPILAWCFGRTYSEDIKTGVAYLRAAVPAPVLASAGIPDSADLRYLANTGSYTILLVGAGPEVAIFANSKLGSIKLAKAYGSSGQRQWQPVQRNEPSERATRPWK